MHTSGSNNNTIPAVLCGAGLVGVFVYARSSAVNAAAILATVAVATLLWAVFGRDR